MLAGHLTSIFTSLYRDLDNWINNEVTNQQRRKEEIYNKMDSDEDIQDYTETTVLLGYAEEDPVGNDTASHLGGAPVCFPSPQIFKSHTSYSSHFPIIVIKAD